MSKNNNSKWLVILNPVAHGGQAGKKWSSIQKLLIENEIDFVFEKTTRRNHATELTEKAIKNGFQKIIGIGGDGTGNEIVNGILKQNFLKSNEVTFALLPIGTGNDWIKTHKIPTHLERWILMLKNEKTTFQDIGRVKCIWDEKKVERYFFNVAGMAYDAFAVQLSDHKSHWAFPKIQYLWLIVAGLFKYKLHRAKLIFNQKEITNHFYTINIGICKYSGGGMQLVPHAIPDDGQFALTYAGKLSKLNVIFNTYRFYNGSLLKHSKVDGFFTKKINVETMDDQPTGVEVDGEFVGETPVTFDIFPKALKIVIP